MDAADVVVVGAGPTGLALAGDLARSGISVVVLDRLAEPSRKPKANAVVGQAARLLGHRGVLARLGHPDPPPPAPVFQFGGLRLDLSAAPRAPLHGVATSQQELEAALAARAADLGVHVRRSHELIDLVEGPGGVTVRACDGTEVVDVVASYVVGCDGAHSRVRELMGIGFPGVTDSAVVSRSAEVTIPGSTIPRGSADIEVAGVGTLGLYRWNRTPRGAWSMLPRASGTVLVSAMEWEEAAASEGSDASPVTVPEVADAVERVLGVAVPMTPPDGPGPHQLRRWRGRNTRIADAYRRGRVLLAGDAAHVHNAVGAPGLNLGLQDAACLGWRLAAAVRGAPELLDGYEPDRGPAARRVATHTQAQTLLLSPGDEVTALRALLGELIEEPTVVARLAGLLEGPDVRYPTDPDAHPLAGWFVPELGGVDGRLDDPRPVLLDLGDAPTVPPAGVAVVALTVPDPPAGAVLVRPDGYVAWAGGAADATGLARVVAALSGAT